jgi:hypothetical protein
VEQQGGAQQVAQQKTAKVVRDLQQFYVMGTKMEVTMTVVVFLHDGTPLDQTELKGVVVTPGKMPSCVPLMKELLETLPTEDLHKLFQRPLF